MKYKYVFMMGRPGCGKSAVYRELEKRLVAEKLAGSFERVDDFPKLWNKFMVDDENEKKGLPRKYSRAAEGGGYKVTNDAMWNDILVDLNADILKKEKKEGHVIFIEFSRSNYIEAFSNFSKEMLDASLIIYIDVNFEICWERNVKRHEEALANKQDDHLVSREEMEKTYLYDDRDALVKSKYNVFVINNEQTGDEFLKIQVQNVIDYLKKGK